MTRIPDVIWRIVLITTLPVVVNSFSPLLLSRSSSSPVLKNTTPNKYSSSVELQKLRRRQCYVRQRQPIHPSSPSPTSSSSLGLSIMSEGSIFEDTIYSAQNIGASLANAVINSASSSSSSTSSTTTNIVESIKSFGILYTAGLWTSISPCSLGLLPITVSYISTAANEQSESNGGSSSSTSSTILPTLAFAVGLASVFTALGVSASAIGGVFGGAANSDVGSNSSTGELLSAFASLISVLMGLQLLELIRVPLPSLDFGMRQSALAFDGGRLTTSRGKGGSLFDANGGLILGTKDITNDAIDVNDDEQNYYTGVLFRMFLLGGTSALVASPCATPVLTSLLAYLASASTTSSSTTSSMAASASSGNVWTGASWMLSYTLGYSTPLLVVGATGGQALVNLRKARETNDGFSAMLGQWVNPITGGVLIAFGMNGLLIALLGDPSISALAPIID